MECVPCGEVEDEPRFKQILEDLIKDGVVQDYPAFSKEKADKREKRKKKVNVHDV